MQHVLVVDDRPDICAVVQVALEENGNYRVSAATDVPEALSFLDRDTPDLLILDAVMPGCHGFLLATDAAARGIPILMMTGEPVMNDALDQVGWSHLRKPFRLDHLLVETRRALQDIRENLRVVRTSLRKMAQTTGELRLILSDINELRVRVQATLGRAKQRPGSGQQA
jgi:DNA-binding NtrC family response regulator